MDINETIFADENRLQVTINNRTPVSLTDLTLSLLAISQQYESFIENSFPSDERPSTELLIKEVRSGSIIVELFANAIPFIPLLWTGGSLLEWASNAKDIALWLQGKLADKPQDLSKSDLKQWNSIIEPIAKDNGSQLNLSVTGNGNTVNLLTVNSNEAVRMQNRIKKEIGKIEDPQEATYKKRVMTWYQAKFDTKSKTGNRAKIESVSSKPLRVLFENNAIMEEMFAQGNEFSRPWQHLAYVVDVHIQTLNGTPRVATIVKFYPEETFDPDEP
ncbi:TPA: hypothetical protein ACGY71_001353 [Stenotrophomonas maltophilia]